MNAETVAEATRRSSLVWVQAGGREQAVWHVWHEGAALVVTGGDEQPFPAGTPVVVVVRSFARQGDRLVQWVADVVEVRPDDDGYDDAVRVLHAARLNAVDGEEQPHRWRRESTVLRLVPTGRTVPLGDDDLAAEPAALPSAPARPAR